ncbi:MAG TPA: hypothetical protein VE993_01310 [Stellaceae bacterium]|nr:hypothetical protein [Stellaceae bacterium]
MRKLILASFAALLLGGGVAAQPAQAACWRIPGGWRCVHRRVVIRHHPWWRYRHPWCRYHRCY